MGAHHLYFCCLIFRHNGLCCVAAYHLEFPLRHNMQQIQQIALQAIAKPFRSCYHQAVQCIQSLLLVAIGMLNQRLTTASEILQSPCHNLTSILHDVLAYGTLSCMIESMRRVD